VSGFEEQVRNKRKSVLSESALTKFYCSFITTITITIDNYGRPT